jgi:lipid A disaccharide synthetase
MIKIYTKMKNGNILVTVHRTPEEMKVKLAELAIKVKKQQEALKRAQYISPEIWNMRVTI